MPNSSVTVVFAGTTLRNQISHSGPFGPGMPGKCENILDSRGVACARLLLIDTYRTGCYALTADFARRAGKNKAHPEGWALVKVSFDAIKTRMYRGTSRGGPIRSSSRRGDCRDRRFPRPPPASRGSGWPRAADKRSLRYGRAGRRLR